MAVLDAVLLPPAAGASVVLDLRALEASSAALSERLHDTLVQDLLANRFLADLVAKHVRTALESVGAAVPERLEGLLIELTENAVLASQRGRALMNDLRPRCLDGADLPEAVARLGDAARCEGDGLAALDPTVAVVAHRLAQAWVTDGAPEVVLTREGDAVRVRASDLEPGRTSALWQQAAAALAPVPTPTRHDAMEEAQ